jgi:signal transduction histidine kinase
VFNSLRVRLIASFLLIVLITLTAAGLALYARLGGYRDELVASDLRQIAAPIYYNLTLFSPQPDQARGAGQRLRRELAVYLEAQSRETGVVVLLVDENGNVIPEATTDEGLLDEHFDVPPPPERGPNFDELPEGTHATADGRHLTFVTVPMPRLVRAQEAGIAAIVVALPESAGPDVYRDLRQRLIFAGVIGVGAAVVAALALSASLYRPLRKVTAGVRSVARGDYRAPVPVSGTNEMRALASDVNAMATSVQASQRTLREFLVNVGHELRTPLTSIHGFAQALLDGTLETPEERARAARVIDVESRRLLQLVGELMDLSRIESGQRRMELRPIRVSDLFTQVADVFALRASDANVCLDIGETAATVLADFDAIEQVLSNLLDNALRHAPRDSRISLNARPEGAGGVEISISDEGPGVAAEDLAHVFDRFYRSADETAGSGTGLGLAISREIVRAHGGEIWAESEPGSGTTFRFTLGKDRTEAPGAAESPQDAGRGEQHQRLDPA